MTRRRTKQIIFKDTPEAHAAMAAAAARDQEMAARVAAAEGREVAPLRFSAWARAVLAERVAKVADQVLDGHG